MKSFIPLKIKRKYWQFLENFQKYWHIYRPIYETNSSITNTILVVGSARSGTTWVGSVCSKIINARPIFEPFILSSQKEFYLLSKNPLNRLWSKEKEKELWMNYLLYIDSELQVDQYLISQIENILKGRVRSQWTDREVYYGRIYTKRIIKEIRINLMLNFLARRWPQMKIIWIIRNPLKVIQSQVYLRVKYHWSFDFDCNMLKQKQLVHDWLAPFIKEIKKAKTLPERLMHRWCIENFVPLNQGVHHLSNVLFVTYEKLVSSKKEWQRISLFLDKKIWDNVTLDEYLNKPSQTYIKRSSEDLDLILRESHFCKGKLIDIVKMYGLEKFLEL